VFAPDIRGIISSTGQVVVKEFMQLIYLELRCIIEWAKKVPGWSDICIFLSCDNFQNLLIDDCSCRTSKFELSVTFDCNFGNHIET